MPLKDASKGTQSELKSMSETTRRYLKRSLNIHNTVACRKSVLKWATAEKCFGMTRAQFF